MCAVLFGRAVVCKIERVLAEWLVTVLSSLVLFRHALAMASHGMLGLGKDSIF